MRIKDIFKVFHQVSTKKSFKAATTTSDCPELVSNVVVTEPIANSDIDDSCYLRLFKPINLKGVASSPDFLFLCDACDDIMPATVFAKHQVICHKLVALEMHSIRLDGKLRLSLTQIERLMANQDASLDDVLTKDMVDCLQLITSALEQSVATMKYFHVDNEAFVKYGKTNSLHSELANLYLSPSAELLNFANERAPYNSETVRKAFFDIQHLAFQCVDLKSRNSSQFMKYCKIQEKLFHRRPYIYLKYVIHEGKSASCSPETLVLSSTAFSRGQATRQSVPFLSMHNVLSVPAISEFEFVKLISEGAYGQVYLGKRKTTGKYYAIKVLQKAHMFRKNQVHRIFAERNILSNVKNDYVVKLYYTMETDKYLYLVMEYAQGGDLYSLIKNLAPLDEAWVRQYTAELILALSYLHKQAIIHRDVKPDNVLIDAQGHIVLTDFGLSQQGIIQRTSFLSSNIFKFKLVPSRKTIYQKELKACGTPDYLAPELLLSKAPTTPAVDVWSLGVLVYEMITGIPPFHSNDPNQIFENVRRGEFFWPEDMEVSSDLKDLVALMLNLDPKKRVDLKSLRKHNFFKDVDWKRVRDNSGPFLPRIDHAHQLDYFERRQPTSATTKDSSDIKNFSPEMMMDSFHMDSHSMEWDFGSKNIGTLVSSEETSFSQERSSGDFPEHNHTGSSDCPLLHSMEEDQNLVDASSIMIISTHHRLISTMAKLPVSINSVSSLEEAMELWKTRGYKFVLIDVSTKTVNAVECFAVYLNCRITTALARFVAFAHLEHDLDLVDKKFKHYIAQKQAPTSMRDYISLLS